MKVQRCCSKIRRFKDGSLLKVQDVDAWQSCLCLQVYRCRVVNPCARGGLKVN